MKSAKGIALVCACAGIGACSAAPLEPARATRAAVAPTSPPAPVCGNAELLTGPENAPEGAVIVPAGDNTGFDFRRPGLTYWFAPGVHTLGTELFGQIAPGAHATFVGGPGAILDGQNANLYAFTGEAEGVTIRYLTIRNFGRGLDNNNEGVVNHNGGSGWIIEHDTIQDNDGAGVFLGSDNILSYNCLKDNGQYGFSMFKMPIESDSAIKNLVLDHNEIVGNNKDDWETRNPGCGCTGGGKFWDVNGARITNNWVHDNDSVGLWADTNNVDFLFEGNYIDHNTDEGIFYEISYNATIRYNTLRRNAWAKGVRNTGSPGPAIYLSESGGDARLASTVSGSTKLRIYENVLEDNFSGISIFENANRFCNSNGNTSKGYCTPFVHPTLIPSPHDETYVNPINATHPCYAQVGNEPYLTDCRWHAQNVEVTNNEFRFDPTVVPCAGTYCGVQALMATGENNIPWSPYTVASVQNAVMFGNGNVFANNHYYGPWRFAKGYGEKIRFDTWQAAPFLQDQGSTSDQGPPPKVPNVFDADTATLEGSTGQWSAWFSDTIAQTTNEAHGGTHSLEIAVTAPDGWGVQLANYPGYDITPGEKLVRIWAKSRTATAIQPKLTIKWLNVNREILQTDTVQLPTLTMAWQEASATVTAPAGTITVWGYLTGPGSAGTTLYIDDISIGDPP
ncbi:right-handed parallel beta-helix repeat-containing protein [Pendulispora brunnea]|uniref:Right-handed parallel beta-helix repeat-containing protein n=1 Tax=Pendulispora brunnea TaxID=2905690 RepID=A0ABZ2K0U6_9BACT